MSTLKEKKELERSYSEISDVRFAEEVMYQKNKPIRKDKKEEKEYREYEYWTIKISKEQTEYDKIRLEILSNLI